MKKVFLLILIILNFITTFAEDFDEMAFMKKVNPNITTRTARIIKDSVDENFHMVSDFLDKKHVYMIIANESRFKQKAVGVNPNGTKDLGLFQISEKTYEHLVDRHIIEDNKSKIFIAKYNIKIGMLLLRLKKKSIVSNIDIKDEYDITLMVLIAYNKGVGGLINDINDGREDFHNFKYIKTIFKFEKYI